MSTASSVTTHRHTDRQRQTDRDTQRQTDRDRERETVTRQSTDTQGNGNTDHFCPMRPSSNRSIMLLLIITQNFVNLSQLFYEHFTQLIFQIIKRVYLCYQSHPSDNQACVPVLSDNQACVPVLTVSPE